MAKSPFQPLSPHINPGIMVSSTVAARSQAVIKYADNILKNFATSVSIVAAPRFSWLLTSANDCIQSQPWKDRSSSIYRNLFVGFYLFLFLGVTTTYVQCMWWNKHTYIVIHTYTYIVIHYIPTYLPIYLSTYIHTDIHTYIHTYTYTHTHIHTYMHACVFSICFYINICVCIYTYIYVCIYICIYTHAIQYIFIYLYKDINWGTWPRSDCRQPRCWPRPCRSNTSVWNSPWRSSRAWL